jgi:hypothetical protein
MHNEKILHIISHDVPWPADYGGVVDLFYKLKALYDEGVKIKLHCFDYGRGSQPELNKYCTEVHYYKRRLGWSGLSLYSPYIVNSRANPQLLENLLKDEHPVLMEGIHCTAFARQLLNRNRKVLLRLHNVESLYYSQLAKTERNFFRKLFFLNESVFLEKYEKRLPENLFIVAVSAKDAAYYKEEFEKAGVEFLPVFIPFRGVSALEGKGNYCLYHGNLSVAENEKAAVWLLEKVFSLINTPIIIAGKNPSGRLLAKVKKFKHCKIVINPADAELNELIKNAHINVLPSFNSTGIKLKIINALYNGRHCVVNDAAVDGSGLEDACHVGTNAVAFASIITQLYQQPFAGEEITLRNKILPVIFDIRANARRLIQWIW